MGFAALGRQRLRVPGGHAPVGDDHHLAVQVQQLTGPPQRAGFDDDIVPLRRRSPAHVKHLTVISSAGPPGDFRLPTSDFRLCLSAFRIPHSAFRRRKVPCYLRHYSFSSRNIPASLSWAQTAFISCSISRPFWLFTFPSASM